ncbi:PhoH family protein [bacterium]|jgi:PhoH-like ATPase|nr:PhoH family protein [bacterium]
MPEKKDKIYVIDTNVFLYDPLSLYEFDGETIGIPISVIEELDYFKEEKSNRGRNAREITRILDGLREQGRFAEGVKLENGSTVKVVFIVEQNGYPDFLKRDIGDNKILATAFCLKKRGYDVRFISKDLNARVKADALGIKARDYVNNNFVAEDQFYRGWVTLEVPSVELKKDIPPALVAYSSELQLNEFVLVQSRSNQFNNKIFRFLGNKNFKQITSPDLKWQFTHKNPQQAMALDLLLDDSVHLVSLLGPAGTGKTFLTLLAGLQKVIIEDVYRKMLISRPVVPLGADIGYLPGDMAEKLQSWMQPVYDNMDFIVNYSRSPQHLKDVLREESFDVNGKGKRAAKKQKKLVSHIPPLDKLIDEGKMSLGAITYMRGRSIPYQYILIDEVQNLTPHEVKTLITRVGQGSKIILAGDPYQIDSPYLNFSSNGLVVASNKFKGQKIFGSVFLEDSERSELSRLAGELL